MGMKSLFQWMPEFWVSIAFLQCGTWMVFMMYAFNMKPEFYSYTIVGPQVVACGAAVITGLLLTLLRVWKGRVVFVHFFLILLASAGFLLVAILSIINAENGQVYSTALTVGGLCHGTIYVAGMCYVHIRAGAFRVQRVAFLHIVYLFGVATTAHSVHEYNKKYTEPRDDGMWEHATTPIAYHFFGFSGAAVIVLLLNFLLNNRCYSGRSMMDNKMTVADRKLDNFKQTLGMPVIQGIAEKAQIMNQFKVLKLMLSAKLTGGLIFNNLLIGLVFYTQRYVFTGENEQYAFIVHYMVIVGMMFGFFASFFVEMKWIFVPGTFLHCSLLIISLAMYTTGSYVAATIFIWLFYIIAGVCYLVPDNGLMEISPLQYYETIAGIGYCFEGVPLMIASYMANQYFPPEVQSLWIAGGIAIAGLLVAAIGSIFWYPDTMNKGILEIQYMLLYPGQMINIRPPVQERESITMDLDYPPRKPSIPPPHTNGGGAIVQPIQPPVVTEVQAKPSVTVTEEVPYPEVQQPAVQGIQAAAMVHEEPSAEAAYPSPPGAPAKETETPKTAASQTTNMFEKLAGIESDSE